MSTYQSNESVKLHESPTPTGCLTKGRVGQLTPCDVVSMILDGFELNDVIAMISLSSLYSKPQITERIVGMSTLAIKRQRQKVCAPRLSAHQSALAFQYAKALEYAKLAFGKQSVAEDWLARSCPQLGGLTPLDIIDNALGFQLVRDYLARIELGVYQ